MVSIFISHAAPDRETAERLKRRLEETTSDSVEFFLSCDHRSIPPGVYWFDYIREALDKTDVMFVLASHHSERSSWVLFESGYVSGRGKPVIPLVLPSFNPASMRPPLQFNQAISLDSFRALNLIVHYLEPELITKSTSPFSPADMETIFGPVGTVATPASAVGAVHLETREHIYSEIVRLVHKSARNTRIRATSTLDDRKTGTDAPFDSYIAAVAEKCGTAKKRGDFDDYTLVLSFPVGKDRLPPPDRQKSIRNRQRAFKRRGAADRIKIRQISEHWSLDTLTIGDDNLVIGFPASKDDPTLRYGIRIEGRDFVSFITDWFDLCVLPGANIVDPNTLKVESKKRATGNKGKGPPRLRQKRSGD
jgi:hypothetical protein